MAKIFSVEKLSINGDNIRIKSSAADKFEITDSNDSVLMSKASIESDVASLNTQDSTNISTVNSSIASLSTLEAGDVSNLDADVASLNTQDATNLSTVNSSIQSVVDSIESNDVVAISTDLATTDGGSKTISFNRTFDSVPAVTASMQAGATDPIIGVQISAISTTECTVQFSDDIPNGNYKLKILASI